MPLGSPTKAAVFGIAMLALGCAAAQASEATLIAERAGFLLGHARRCGADEARLERSEAVIGGAIAAFARDDDDKEEAATRFAQRVLASALAKLLGDPTPNCRTVLAEVARLERRRPPALAQSQKQGERLMAQRPKSDLEAGTDPAPDHAAGAKRADARKTGKTRPEELTVDERAAFELKRVARQMRGWPPSI